MDWLKEKLSRRAFLKLVGGATLGAAGLYALAPLLRSGHAPLGADEALRLRQLVAGDNARARVVQWHSQAAREDAVLEYRVRGAQAARAVTARSAPFVDGGVAVQVHTALLTQLQPGTDYQYRVGYGERRGAWHPLRTDGGGAFKALLFPDSQSSDYSDWKQLAQAAYKAHPDAAFFANLGDLVDNGEDASQWRAWFDALEGMREAIPLAPVLGNHETYDLNWKVRMPQAYLQLFELPENGSTAYRNQYYSFEYGDVHFSVLNTQLEEMLPLQSGLRSAQLEWFEQDMARCAKPWKVVLMHKDVLTYEIRGRAGRTAGVSEIGRMFMPLFDRYEVDVVLTAHLHTYRRRARLRDFQPDARGPLYVLTGVAGNVRYPNFWIDHPFDEKIAPQPETDNYLTMEASADALRLVCYLPSGAEIDRVELTKGASAAI